MDRSYEGFYARFDTPDKKTGSMFMGADDLVGNDYTIDMRVQDGKSVAWIKNKFGKDRGFLDEKSTRRVQLALGRGQEVRAILSFVAYSDTPEPGIYWGEVAVFCFNPAYAEEMNAFADNVAAKMADGIRPNIDLGSEGVRKIFDEPGWVPGKTAPLPDKKKKGFAILKDSQSMSEKAIEQGRGGNKGCYAVSWVFIVVVVAALILGGLKVFGII